MLTLAEQAAIKALFEMREGTLESRERLLELTLTKMRKHHLPFDVAFISACTDMHVPADVLSPHYRAINDARIAGGDFHALELQRLMDRV